MRWIVGVLLIVVAGCSSSKKENDAPAVVSPEELVKNWKAYDGKRVMVEFGGATATVDKEKQIVTVGAPFPGNKGWYLLTFPISESAKIIGNEKKMTAEGIASSLSKNASNHDVVKMTDCRVVHP